MHSLPSHQLRRPGMVVLFLLALAQLMVILDISAVNVALPDLARDLDIGGGNVGWTITSYSLVFGSLLLLGGRAVPLVGDGALADLRLKRVEIKRFGEDVLVEGLIHDPWENM